MPAVSPADRDRGLRLVGTVTGAVAAVSLVAVGATTALAAGDTEQHDDVRAVVVATSTPPATGSIPVVSGTSAPPVPRRASAEHSATHTVTAKARPHSPTTHPSTPPAKSAPVTTYATPPPVPSTGS